MLVETCMTVKGTHMVVKWEKLIVTSSLNLVYFYSSQKRAKLIDRMKYDLSPSS